MAALQGRVNTLSVRKVCKVLKSLTILQAVCLKDTDISMVEEVFSFIEAIHFCKPPVICVLYLMDNVLSIVIVTV